MPTYYTDLFTKLTAAAAGLVSTPYPTFNVYQGEGNATLSPPCVQIYAQNSNEEDPPDSGNFWANLEISVFGIAVIDTDGADPKPAYDLMVQKVMDLFMSSTLTTDLNSVGILNFTAIGARTRTVEFDAAPDGWRNTLAVQILCCPSTLYP